MLEKRLTNKNVSHIIEEMILTKAANDRTRSKQYKLSQEVFVKFTKEKILLNKAQAGNEISIVRLEACLRKNKHLKIFL